MGGTLLQDPLLQSLENFCQQSGHPEPETLLPPSGQVQCSCPKSLGDELTGGAEGGLWFSHLLQAPGMLPRYKELYTEIIFLLSYLFGSRDQNKTKDTRQKGPAHSFTRLPVFRGSSPLVTLVG